MIKNCPLCGGQVETKLVPENSQTIDFVIRCKKCKCEVKRYLDYARSDFEIARKTMEELENVWNKREYEDDEHSVVLFCMKKEMMEDKEDAKD